MSVLIDFYAGNERRMAERVLSGGALQRNDYQDNLDWQQYAYLDGGSPGTLDALSDAIAAVIGKAVPLFTEASRDLNDEMDPPPDPMERWPTFIVAENWIRTVGELGEAELVPVVRGWASRIGESIGPNDAPPDMVEALRSLVDFCRGAVSGGFAVLFRVC